MAKAFGHIGLRVHQPRGWFFAAFWTIFIGLAAMAAALAGGPTAPPLGVPLLTAIVSLTLLVGPYMVLAMTSWQRDVTLWFGRKGPKSLGFVAISFVALYLFYGLGTGALDLFGFARLVIFVSIPTVLALSAGRGGGGVKWQDWLLVASIWLPFNFGLLDKIWTWPEGEAAYVLNTPMAIDLAMVMIVCFRRYDFVRFRLKWSWWYLAWVVGSLAAFLLIALPVGLNTGFLKWNPRIESIKLVLTPLGIFFFIALPEELLFRGLLQGLFKKVLKKPYWAIICASLLFGMSHWHEPGLPDWRYVSLASIAGMLYGLTYDRTGSLFASAVLHTSVDSLWDLLFHV